MACDPHYSTVDKYLYSRVHQNDQWVNLGAAFTTYDPPIIFIPARMPRKGDDGFLAESMFLLLNAFS